MLAARRHHADERLVVRSHAPSQSGRDSRQPARVGAHPEQQRHGSQHSAGQDDTVRGVFAIGLAIGGAQPRLNHVAALDPGPDGKNLGLRLDPRSASLGQKQVVVIERVLGTHATSRHAAATQRAAHALGPGAAEIRISYFGFRLGEAYGHVGQAEVLVSPELLRDLLEHLIPGVYDRVLGHTQHPAGRLVVRAQLALPVRELGPGPRLEEGVPRPRQGIGVYERGPPPPPRAARSGARRRTS